MERKRVARGEDEEKMVSIITLKADGQHASGAWRGGLCKKDGAAGVKVKGRGKVGEREGFKDRRSWGRGMWKDSKVWRNG